MINKYSDYRICYHNNKHVDSYYQIHRVDYDEIGEIIKINNRAQEPYGNTTNDLICDLGKMINSYR
jgi:hypothetical protein